MLANANHPSSWAPSACLILSIAGCGGGGSGGSSGPALIAVPSVVGDSQTVAAAAITGAGLTLGAVTIAANGSVVSGSVISATPTPGTRVTSGTSVSLAVSGGPGAIPQIVTSDSGRTTLNYYLLNFHANDLVWDTTNQIIYFAIAANSSVMPSTIVAVDPLSGLIKSQITMAFEPQRLAVSDNGQYLYAGLLGGGGVVRLNAPQLTTDINIAVGELGTYFTQIAVAPGMPRTVAVAASAITHLAGPGLAIFDDAVKRPNVLSGNIAFQGGFYSPDIEGFAWDPSGSMIYAPGLWDVAVDAQGVTLQAIKMWRINFPPTYINGLLYTTDGFVYDIANDLVRGRFGDYAGEAPRSYLLANNKTFSIHDHYQPNSEPPTVDGPLIASFDPSTFTLIDTIHFVSSAVGPTGARFVSWGTNGFAVASGQAVIASGAFASPETVPSVPPPTSIYSGAIQSTQGTVNYSVFDIGANNVIADSCTGQFFVATTGVSAEGVVPYAPNSLIAFSPSAGAFQGSVFAGSEPLYLAISDDCSYVYAALYYSNSIQRINASTLGQDLLIPINVTNGTAYATIVDVAPGQPHTIVASLQNFNDQSCAPQHYNDLIYDDATARANSLGPTMISPEQLIWGDTASIIYGTDTADVTSNDQAEFSSWSIDGGGFESRTLVLAPPPVGDYFHYDRAQGRLFDSYLDFVDLRTGTPTGQKIQATWTPSQYGCGYPAQAGTTDAAGAALYTYSTPIGSLSAYLDVAVYEPNALVLTNHWELPLALGDPSHIASLPNSVAVVMQSGELVIFSGAVGH
jgi:PASTA domain-containing protein